jgi:hypothetical protein
MRRTIALVSVWGLLLQAPHAWGEQGNAARIVAWQPRTGAEAAFENGYKRHLAWHREHRDPWTWLGWTIISGERTGDFVDGTFFHAWADFDAPVAPAEDAADNRVNVYPHATLRSNTTYEAIAQFPERDPRVLTSPLLTFVYIGLAANQASTFEVHASSALRAHAATAILLKPVRGSTEYLMLLPAADATQAPAHAEAAQQFVKAVESAAKEPIVRHVRTETARYRADMSYRPD